MSILTPIFGFIKSQTGDNIGKTIGEDLPANWDKVEQLINDLDADKVDNSRVLTDVPSNAKFTDTVYTHPATHAASMITDLPTSLPANGGNSDTVDSKHVWVGAEGSKGTDANTIYFCY